MEKKARAGWVDAARGIGILLIVLIHSIRPDMREANAACRLVYELIISFVNGMFFVLAGVTYRMAGGRREEAPGRFLMKKARALLLPFFGYALLVYAAFSFAAWFPPTARVFQGTEYGRMPLGEYLQLTLREDSPYAAHLWFIWVLFWITAAVYAADSLCKRWGLPRQRVLWAIALAGCVAGTLVGGGNSAAVRVLTHTVYFVYGTEFAVRPALPERSGMSSALAAVLSAGVMVRVVLYGVHTVTWYGAVLWQVVWLLVRLVFLRGLFQLAARLQNTAWLTYLGRESFWVYLLHQPFCCGFVGLVLYSKLGLPIPAACAAAIVLGLTLPCCAVWLGRWASQRLWAQD